MNKPKYLDKLNVYLEAWKGSRVFLNSYTNYDNGADQLRIVLEKQDKEITGTKIFIIGCVFLSGPTSWLNCNLKCRTYNEGEVSGFEVFDDSNGFLVRCLNSVVVGDGELILSYNE